MAFVLSFNAHQVAPNVAPEPVPTGTYPVVITDSQEKAVANSEDGRMYMEFTMEIISGEFKGRRIVERLNHKNPSAQTREIAMSTLSSIAHVTGVMVIQQSSQELHNKPFQVKVVKVPRDDNRELFSNNVRGYLDAMGYEPGKKPAQDVANGTAGGWGSTTTQQQDTGNNGGGWNAGGQQTQQQQERKPDPAPQQQTQQQANPWAADVRYITLLANGIAHDAAVAALTAQGATPQAAQQTQQTQAPQRDADAPSQSDVERQAAAMFAQDNGGGNAGGGEPTPDWAK